MKVLETAESNSSPTGGAKLDKSEPYRQRLGFVILCGDSSGRVNRQSVNPCIEISAVLQEWSAALFCS